MKTQASKIAESRHRSAKQSDESLLTHSISFEKKAIKEKMLNRLSSPAQSGTLEAKLRDSPSQTELLPEPSFQKTKVVNLQVDESIKSLSVGFF